MREWTVGQTVVRVARADITQLAVDAIVNAANNALWMGGGVAGAIKRAGGTSIERDAQAQGPIAIGEAVVTGAGKLACRYVIHAATMGQDLVTDETAIRLATRNALCQAQERDLQSIAFPALGTGVGGFPLDASATLMGEEILRHCQKAGALRLIVLVAFSDEAERAFSLALTKLIPK